MKVALLAVDSDYPNLALMKLSAFHKAQGDIVEWYSPFDYYDRLYMAKVFSFTNDYCYYLTNVGEVVRGGTGYDIHSVLPDDVDRLQPDYSAYPRIPDNVAYGFLTRGCPNHCRWCIVPQKEGAIRPYMDVDEIAAGGRDHLILMDNNVLACDYGLSQIEKIVARKYHVDFNQALDARLVTPDVALLLATCNHALWRGRVGHTLTTRCPMERRQTMADAIIAVILLVINLFWGYVWFQIGRFIGQKEKEDEQNN